MFRGADLRYDLELDLEQAVFGHESEVEFTTLGECETCKGSGAEPDSKAVTCETCHGSGQVRMQQGIFAVQQTCPRCKGRGQVITQPCDTCLGQGRIRKKKNLAVKVPAGVDNGDRIRLAGEGEAGRNGGPPGDLYVEIRVREHAIFERDGSHLSCEVPVSFATATLGGTVEVPTLGGNVELKVPTETQSGRVFRLREKGVKPVRGGPTGDLFCRVVVETPVNLTDEQKGAAAQAGGIDAREHSQSQPAAAFLAGRREALLRHDAQLTRMSGRELQVAIFGVSGRMGRAVIAAVEESPGRCRERHDDLVRRSCRCAARCRRRHRVRVAPGDCRQSRCLRRCKAADRHRHDRARRCAARPDRRGRARDRDRDGAEHEPRREPVAEAR